MPCNFLHNGFRRNAFKFVLVCTLDTVELHAATEFSVIGGVTALYADRVGVSFVRAIGYLVERNVLKHLAVETYQKMA